MSSESFILFISPERLMQEVFVQYLSRLQLKLIVIDEAHCIVEWGSEFRPDYQKLGLLKKTWRLPILALTASATPQMRSEISRHLGLESPHFICSGFFRHNLFYQVQLCADFEAKMAMSIYAIQKVEEGRILIYCATRLQCEAVAKRLGDSSFQRVSFYHAGLTARRRFEIQTLMNSGQIKILCCTCAFGMGIDYPDVRLVIHFEVPTSLEELYQEMGRAGRDQAPALALSLYSERDLQMKSLQLNSQNKNSRESLRKRKALEELERYLRLERCRHRMISEYFGDTISFQNIKSCEVCDSCCGSLEANQIPQIFDLRLRNRLKKLFRPANLRK